MTYGEIFKILDGIELIKKETAEKNIETNTICFSLVLLKIEKILKEEIKNLREVVKDKLKENPKEQEMKQKVNLINTQIKEKKITIEKAQSKIKKINHDYKECLEISKHNNKVNNEIMAEEAPQDIIENITEKIIQDYLPNNLSLNALSLIEPIIKKE